MIFSHSRYEVCSEIMELNFQESLHWNRMWEIEPSQGARVGFYEERSCCGGNYLVGSAPQERCALIPLLCSAWAGSHPESLCRVRTLHCKAKSVQNERKS